MALIVEDGTGRTDAQSLIDVATADSYWSARSSTVSWALETVTANKEKALVLASDYLRNQSRLRWSGTKKTYAQLMPWPRTGASEQDGADVPENVVPWQVKEAVCWLANLALTTELQPALERGGKIRSESVGPISTTYADDAPAETVYQQVMGLLQPLTRRLSLTAIPGLYTPEIPDGYQANQFTDGLKVADENDSLP